MACSRANSAATRSESSIAVLSMISSVSVEGAIPLSRSASTTSSYRTRTAPVHRHVHRDAEVGDRARSRASAARAAGLAQHDPPDLRDRAGLLGDRYEHVGGHERAVRAPPPRERLQAVGGRCAGRRSAGSAPRCRPTPPRGPAPAQARALRRPRRAWRARTPRRGPCPRASPRTWRCRRRAAGLWPIAAVQTRRRRSRRSAPRGPPPRTGGAGSPRSAAADGLRELRAAVRDDRELVAAQPGRVSSARTQPSRRCAAERSSSSPARWPSVSFTFLKPSRSTGSPRPCRAPPGAPRSRSSSSTRLARPVSGSWWAWCVSSSSAPGVR